LNNFYKANSSIITTAATGFSALDNKTIDSAITGFSETVKVVMGGLDALGSVHPFIGTDSTSVEARPSRCGCFQIGRNPRSNETWKQSEGLDCQGPDATNDVHFIPVSLCSRESVSMLECL
jgi:hypothetical protein